MSKGENVLLNVAVAVALVSVLATIVMIWTISDSPDTMPNNTTVENGHSSVKTDKSYAWYLENEVGTGSDLDVMARILYAEGGNQSEECLEWIGRTVLNRVLHKGFPNTISGVVYEVNTYRGKTVYQFTPVMTGSIDNKSSEKCYKVAKKLLDEWESGTYVVTKNVIAFDACGPNVRPHSNWCDYAFTVGDVAFYTAR